MIAWFLEKYLTPHALRVRDSSLDPLSSQTETFSRLKKLLRESELSNQTGFDRCSSLEETRDLARSDAESLRPFFERALKNGGKESGVFGASPIVGFGRTSGSQALPKDIPLNREYLKSLDRSLVRMVASYLFTTQEWKRFAKGKHIMLGSRLTLGHAPCGLPIHDISGLTQTRVPKLFRSSYIPRRQDLSIEDWSKRAEKILEQSAGQRVVSLIGIPALALDLVDRAKKRFGFSRVDQFWPDLRFLIYGGVSLPSDQKSEIIRSWFGRDYPLQFVETYMTTEGGMGFSFNPNDEGMVLNTLENLYLFYPENNKTPVFAHELESGKKYSISVTTPGGLINYSLGDWIEACSTQPLRIKITGREKQEISMTGEKISLSQIDLACQCAGVPHAISTAYWPIVWIETAEKPRLVWGLPEPSLSSSDSALAERLDQALCKVNTLYAESLVHEKVIANSRVVAVPLPFFEKYIRANLGIAQFKPRRIFNSTQAMMDTYGFTP